MWMKVDVEISLVNSISEEKRLPLQRQYDQKPPDACVFSPGEVGNVLIAFGSMMGFHH